MGIRQAALFIIVTAWICAAPSAATAESPQVRALQYDVLARVANARSLSKPAPFEFAAADVDLDGDVDLVVNWHLDGVDLYLNKGGGDFDLLDREQSGLFHEGNVLLYARQEEVTAAANKKPGIYVWHDPIPFGNWNIYVSAAPQGESTVDFELRSNEIIEEFEGVHGDELTRVDALQTREDAWASFSLAASALPRHIKFRTRHIGSDIRITKSSALPFLLGKTFLAARGDSAHLRMADPHAMAWVNSVSSEQPDLFIARGGNRGRLKPPFEAKRNRFFVAGDTENRLFDFPAREAVPSDYGRGRSLAWVDIQGDRQNELYVGNMTSTNSLLALDKALHQFEDQASRLGLALPCGDAFTWMDFNGDGFDDLLFLTCYGSLAIARNHNGRQFSIANAEDLGLILGAMDRDAKLFQSTTINSFDYDSDGDLDILLSGLGKELAVRVFDNDSGKFNEVTEDLGLARATSNITIATDIDQDGYPDLVTGGKTGLALLQNQDGASFTPTELGTHEDTPFPDVEITALLVADVSGNGLKDIVAGGKGYWWILSNREAAAGRTLSLALREADGFEPIGTVVRAHYDSGRVLAQRYGSADNNGLSQHALPLSFSARHDEQIEYFTVAAPGSESYKRVELDDKSVRHPE